MKHILVAYDGSEAAEHAFEYARLLARRYASTIAVLCVSRRPLIGDDGDTTAIVDEGLQRAEEGIRRLRLRTREDEFEVSFLTAVGSPAAEIIAGAHKTDADLIVMGNPHKSLLGRWLSGSTRRHVIGHSRCPVLIVP